MPLPTLDFDTFVDSYFLVLHRCMHAHTHTHARAHAHDTRTHARAHARTYPRTRAPAQQPPTHYIDFHNVVHSLPCALRVGGMGGVTLGAFVRAEVDGR